MLVELFDHDFVKRVEHFDLLHRKQSEIEHPFFEEAESLQLYS